MTIELEQESNLDKTFEKNYSSSKKESKMCNFLIKRGISKDRKNAEKLLIIFSITLIIISIIICYTSIFQTSVLYIPKNPNAKIIQEYRAQGLTGKALLDKIQEGRASGLIK